MPGNCVTLQYLKSPECDAPCGITTAIPDTAMMTSSVSEQAQECEIRGLYCTTLIKNSGLLGRDALSLS